MLTVIGLRRRGIPAEVINKFASAPTEELQLNQLYDMTCRHFDMTCSRRVTVIDPLKCYVNNFEEFILERSSSDDLTLDDYGSIRVTVADHPLHNDGNSRILLLKQEFYINRFDFNNESDKKILSQHYLTRNNSVLLRNASALMNVEKVEFDKNGKATLLLVNLKYVTTRSKKTKVLTWLSDMKPATLNLFENILMNENLNKETSLLSRMNANSWRKCPIYVEDSVFETIKIGDDFSHGQTFQAERLGYLTIDPSSTTKDIQLNMTCMLKLHHDMKSNIVNACSSYNVADSL